MKKSTKMLGFILAVIMVIGIFPLSISADNNANSAKNEQSLPYYIVRCVLSTGAPAQGAEIALSAPLDKNGRSTYTADENYGTAMIPKEFSGLYNISVKSEGPVEGLEWTTPAGLCINFNLLPEVSCQVLYPVLNVGLEFGQHNAYMVGYSDGSFKPEQTITKAEAATLIYRIMTDEARAQFSGSENRFADVQKGMAHNDAISALVNAGLIDDSEGGVFGYKAVISRAQFAEMIGRLFPAVYTGENVFPDIENCPAAPYLNLLGALGIFRGDGDGKVNPDAPLTRGAACAIINRLLGRMPSEESIDTLSGSDTLKSFSDVSTDMALYADIMEATNSHSFSWNVALPDTANGVDDGVSEDWISLNSSIFWIKS